MTRPSLRSIRSGQAGLLLALLVAANSGFAQQTPSTVPTSSALSAAPSTGPAAAVKSAKPVKKTPAATSKSQVKDPAAAGSTGNAPPDAETLDGTTVRGRRQDDHPNVHSVFEKAFPQSDGAATTESSDVLGNRVECIKNCSVGADCCKTVKANVLSGPDPNGLAGH